MFVKKPCHQNSFSKCFPPSPADILIDFLFHLSFLILIFFLPRALYCSCFIMQACSSGWFVHSIVKVTAYLPHDLTILSWDIEAYSRSLLVTLAKHSRTLFSPLSFFNLAYLALTWTPTIWIIMWQVYSHKLPKSLTHHLKTPENHDQDILSCTALLWNMATPPEGTRYSERILAA